MWQECANTVINDITLQRVVKGTITDWPGHYKPASYFWLKEKQSIVDGVFFRGGRLIMALNLLDTNSKDLPRTMAFTMSHQAQIICNQMVFWKMGSGLWKADKENYRFRASPSAHEKPLSEMQLCRKQKTQLPNLVDMVERRDWEVHTKGGK